MIPEASRTWMALAAAHGFVAVAAGAFGAHALRPRVTPRLFEVFETGARYQMYHALALVAVAWLASHRADLAAPVGWSFNVGIALFSGSLYAMTLTGVTRLGIVTPFGGVAFLAGWALLARAALGATSA